MQGETSEEDAEHEGPLKVQDQVRNEAAFIVAISHGGESNVTEAVEDDDNGEPNFPGVDVVLVQISVEPSDRKVIGSRHDPGCSDGVIGSNVRDDGYLGRETDVAEEESAEQRGERSLVDPHAHWVEEQLVTAVGILLPASKFVVDGKGDTFLEAITGPSGKTDDETITLETKRHVEILGHVRLGPELFVIVFVDIRYLLNGGPAENGIVADKGCNIAVGYSVPDGGVDQVGKESDPVLEVGVDDLHDTGRELHDTHIGRLLHFGAGIEKTVSGNASVGVNCGKISQALWWGFCETY